MRFLDTKVVEIAFNATQCGENAYLIRNCLHVDDSQQYILN